MTAPPPTVRSAVLAVALVLAHALAGAAHAQPAEPSPWRRSLWIAPGWLQGDDASAPGVRFEGSAARDAVRDAGGDVGALPAWLTASVALRGALATDAEANPEALALDARAGWLQTFYRPGTAPDDPDAPTTGGYDRGALELAARAAAEADQRFREAYASAGAEARYLAPNAAAFLGAGPRLGASYALVVALASDVRDALGEPTDDPHGRLDLTAEWHPYLPRTPLRLHVGARYWLAHGLDAAVEQVLGRRGYHGSYAVAYAPPAWRVRTVRVQEVFVRFTHGDLPVAPAAEQAWMIGLRIGG